MFPKCSLDVPNIAMLREHSANIPGILRASWDVPYNTKEIRRVYRSKCNFKRENKVILLTITDGKKWHYLLVKKLSPLLREITPKYNGDFFCLNYFHSYTTKDKLKKHKDVCEKHDYCSGEMPKEDNKIIEYNNGEKSMKVPFIIYPELEYLLEKMSSCHNNHQKSSATKINKHTASTYLLFTKCSFDTIKNKIDCYRGTDSKKNFPSKHLS